MADDVLSEIRSRRIGFIFQNFNLIQQLTVLENLEVPMFYLGIPPLPSGGTRAMELAERVGLERAPRPPADAAFGRAAAARLHRARDGQRPADSSWPTSRRERLDSKTGQQILELFDELVASGRTIMLVTHDPQRRASLPSRDPSP